MALKTSPNNAVTIIVNNLWRFTFILGLSCSLIFLWFVNGSWALGVFLGTIIASLNILLLYTSLKKIEQKKSNQNLIKKNLLYFGLFFIITVIIITLLLYFKLGHPFGFLLGLAILWVALIPAVLVYLFNKKSSAI